MWCSSWFLLLYGSFHTVSGMGGCMARLNHGFYTCMTNCNLNREFVDARAPSTTG